MVLVVEREIPSCMRSCCVQREPEEQVEMTVDERMEEARSRGEKGVGWAEQLEERMEMEHDVGVEKKEKEVEEGEEKIDWKLAVVDIDVGGVEEVCEEWRMEVDRGEADVGETVEEEEREAEDMAMEKKWEESKKKLEAIIFVGRWVRGRVKTLTPGCSFISSIPLLLPWSSSLLPGSAVVGILFPIYIWHGSYISLHRLI